ncbi:unnamed protein product, partial [Polarella glacialis]
AVLLPSDAVTADASETSELSCNASASPAGAHSLLHVRLSTREGNKVPVVFLWFGPAAFPFYFLLNMGLAAEKNRVVVLTDLDLQSTESNLTLLSFEQRQQVQLVDITSWEATSASFFGEAHLPTNATAEQLSSLDAVRYRPFGKDEPWQSRNVQRHFILLEFMKATNTPVVFLADADVALFLDVNAARSLYWKPEGCSATVAPDDRPGERLVWTGSAYLSQELLGDFVAFLYKLYSPMYLDKLMLIHQQTWIGDMILWAIYFGLYKDVFQGPNIPWPETRNFTVCDSGKANFDSSKLDDRGPPEKTRLTVGADNETLFYWNTTGQEVRLLSLHFLGGSKDTEPDLLAPLIEYRRTIMPLLQ